MIQHVNNYIYIYREREREIDTPVIHHSLQQRRAAWPVYRLPAVGSMGDMCICVYVYIHIYIYIYIYRYTHIVV